MCDKTDTLENNPFAYLFPNLEEARKYSREAAAKLATEEINVNGKSTESGPSSSNADEHQKPNHSTKDQKKNKVLTKEERINKTAEYIFGITLSKNTEKSLVWLEEFSTDPETQLINLSNLEQVLFERLLLEDPTHNLINPPTSDSHYVQTEVITYLLECHKKLNRIAGINKNEEIKHEIQEMQMLILRNASTALRQPQLYESQNLNSQVLQIFYETHDTSSEEVTTFFNGIINELLKEKDETPNIILETFAPVFEFVYEKTSMCNIYTFEHALIFSFLHTVVNNKYLAEAFLDHCTPEAGSPGSKYSTTLLGGILQLSCLPKYNRGTYEFFDSPNDPHAVKTHSDTVWTFLKCIADNLHQLFLTLLKLSPEVKHKTLEWLGNCLHANAGRGSLANVDEEEGIDLRNLYASDGFMLNLSAVLLRLCEPFIVGYDTPKILKIDPTFCVANITDREEARRRHCHMQNLHSETCLLPLEDGEVRPVSDTFNFITECFFLTQKSLDLGFRVCCNKIYTILKQLSKLQRPYNTSVATRGANNVVTERIQEVMNSLMQKSLSLRAAMAEPRTLDLLAKLTATSANWLIQIMLNAGEPEPHILKSMKPLVLPFPEEIPITLKCVPEFTLLNLTHFLLFVKRCNKETLEESGFDWFEPVLSVIIAFMGSPRRISNPHLRAGLAESMEALLPHSSDDPQSVVPNPLGVICKSNLFKQHPFSKAIVQSLLDVFVSIEMTGQGVQFQEKFNYRRPMYVVMDYLWTDDQHKNCFKNLAAEAEMNMEAVPPPLFLRFLNLLINDAVFLLDEALSHMAQVKTMQAARDSGEWAALPPSEQHQNERAFEDVASFAGFHNILARWTIHTLEFLTSEIKSIFWHPVLVARVAAMLNYFLHHLVGPNKKNFSVKDKEEFNFKPDVFVKDICKIYVHLYESDDFCLAVCQDGMSYNSELFNQAQDVLARIGGGPLIGEIKEVNSKVSYIASRMKIEEEMLPDAPEEFLDPIMSTIMTDPVILPSSRQVVDRSTIARHLLSDESDPFNRSPLTVDKVISHDELREKIQAWLNERRQQINDQIEEKMAEPSSSSSETK